MVTLLSDITQNQFTIYLHTKVQSNTVLFNLFVNAEPLMYFCVCHGTPLKKIRNYELLGQKIKYFVITLLHFKK